MNKTKRVYTAEEAAEILGVCYRTVLNNIKVGRLPAYRICGSYRITAEQLDFFQKQETHVYPFGDLKREEVKLFFDNLPDAYAFTVDDIKDINTELNIRGVEDLTANNYFNALAEVYKLGFARGKNYERRTSTRKNKKIEITEEDIF